MSDTEEPTPAPQASERTQLRGGVGARGGDHPPARFRRGVAERDLDLVSEGKSLIELCASELAAVGGALQELRLDDLVSRLEDEAGQ